MSTVYKKGRTTPLVYLSISKASNPEFVREIIEGLKNFDIDLIKYEGGNIYDKEKEEKRIAECDFTIVVGPTLAMNRDLPVGKGQALQVIAFMNYNSAEHVLLVDEFTPHPRRIMVSRLDCISNLDSNNYINRFALLERRYTAPFSLTYLFNEAKKIPVAENVSKLESLNYNTDPLTPVLRKLVIARRRKLVKI